MEVDVVITRDPKRQGGDGTAIPLDDWLEFVRRDPSLRHRTQPSFGRNPKTGEPIEIPSGDGASEMLFGEDAESFLSFEDGDLVGRIYVFDDGENAMRDKVVDIARHFEAAVTDPERERLFDW